MDYAMHHFGFDVNAVIDYPKSKCFCVSHGTSYSGIRLNVKGREPTGVVESRSSYEVLRDFMITELKKLKDPVKKQPVIKKTYKTENLYWGPYIDQLPDIIVETEGEYVISPNFETYSSVVNSTTYTHDIDGILMTVGPHIRRNTELKSQVNAWDVAPTILHILGVPIPSDMDGRVLKEIFEPDSDLEKRAVVFEKVERIEKRVYRRKKEEEEEIRRRLGRLGYI
jgi:predicted AlkP superfamily phosphohydrolase/phosphomutase